MNDKQKIKAFVEASHTHLNAGERKRIGLWAVFVFGCAAVLATLPFVLRGFRVDRRILWMPLAASIGVAVVLYLRKRYTRRRAVGQADRFFDLKEGLVTADEHIREGRSEEIHRLQLRHTEHLLGPHDPGTLRGSLSRKMMAFSAGVLLVAGTLLALDDSEAVKQARAERDAASLLAEELGEDLSESLEEMLERMEQESKELVEDPTLKQMLQELTAEGDRKAVMRRMAEIDQHLAQMQNGLDTRADENYLAELAQQLRQSRDTSALGKALEQRKYKQAASELEKMKLDGKNDPANQQALEQLASSIEGAEKSMASTDSGARRNAREMSRQIQRMQQEQKKNGQSSQECRSGTNQSLAKSGKSMRSLAARKSARSALEQLRSKLQEGQGRMANGSMPGAGQGTLPGNSLAAGEGVDRSRRNPNESSPSEGILEHLSGQLGEGESEKRIEDAASGTGVASDTGGERTMGAYRRQMEAFVQREDIPEEMKHGVKTYFKQLHNVESDPDAEGREQEQTSQGEE